MRLGGFGADEEVRTGERAGQVLVVRRPIRRDRVVAGDAARLDAKVVAQLAREPGGLIGGRGDDGGREGPGARR